MEIKYDGAGLGYKKQIRKIAEANVLEIRGTYDAPGFDACVDAEIRRLEDEGIIYGRT